MTNIILLKSLYSIHFKQQKNAKESMPMPIPAIPVNNLIEKCALTTQGLHSSTFIFLGSRRRAYIFSGHFFLTRLCIVQAKIIEKVCVYNVQCTCSIDLIWDSLG
jgi:hypothetical protein